MVVIKKEISPVLKEFPIYKILDNKKEKVKKEVNFFKILETDSDPLQKRKNERKWKQTLGYYLLHPEKFKFGFKDLK